SEAPPGANGTTRRIGLLGQASCAVAMAGSAIASAAIPSANARRAWVFAESQTACIASMVVLLAFDVPTAKRHRQARAILRMRLRACNIAVRWLQQGFVSTEWNSVGFVTRS